MLIYNTLLVGSAVRSIFGGGGRLMNSMRTPSSSVAAVAAQTSHFEIQGPRSYMEDRTVIGLDGRLVAVFDGHGGSAVAQLLSESFLPTLVAKLPSKLSDCEDITAPITETFRELANIYRSNGRFPVNVGSCAVVSYLQLDTEKPAIITANIGDSRVVFARL